MNELKRKIVRVKSSHNVTITKVEKHKNVWYLDNRCSNHITRDKEAFIDMDSSFSLEVKLGNGEYIEVKGKESIDITTKQGGRTIHDILYVPTLS
ncbi:hypothetical protein L6164_013204 [Bauhinia variegata]|uniref:Uncharacterized protein n=1 Tax=Bauhinia variegata TaxID=167791 RepID=A0ACB9PF68_BAUVA|nr:hypothetical protein L6164_013204 [Bauhinia variegata]